MTEALYLASDDLECTGRVLSCRETQEGLWAVVCDRTVFHPQGGGQPSDIGLINDVSVRKVIHTPDAIIHLCEAPLEGEVSMAVDGKTRRLHSRLHSAGHIIGFVGDELGWHATKGNHFPGESRVVFEPENPKAIQLTEAEVLQSEVNALISKTNGDEAAKSKNAFLKFVWIDTPLTETENPNFLQLDEVSVFLIDTPNGYNFSQVIENPFFLGRNMLIHNIIIRGKINRSVPAIAKAIPSQPHNGNPMELTP